LKGIDYHDLEISRNCRFLINFSLDWFKGKSTGKPQISYYFMVKTMVSCKFPINQSIELWEYHKDFFHGRADNLGDRDGDLNIKLVTKKRLFHLFMLHE